MCLGDLNNWHNLMKIRGLYEEGIADPTELHFSGDLSDICLDKPYKGIAKGPMNEFRTQSRMHYQYLIIAFLFHEM